MISSKLENISKGHLHTPHLLALSLFFFGAVADPSVSSLYSGLKGPFIHGRILGFAHAHIPKAIGYLGVLEKEEYSWLPLFIFQQHQKRCHWQLVI